MTDDERRWGDLFERAPADVTVADVQATLAKRRGDESADGATEQRG